MARREAVDRRPPEPEEPGRPDVGQAPAESVAASRLAQGFGEHVEDEVVLQLVALRVGARKVP